MHPIRPSFYYWGSVIQDVSVVGRSINIVIVK